MEIRQAQPEHAGEIARLNDTVQKMHAAHHPDVFKYPTDAAETERFFRERMSADDHFIFVATIAGHAVGFAQLSGFGAPWQRCISCLVCNRRRGR